MKTNIAYSREKIEKNGDKKVDLRIFKSWDVFFVTTIMCMHLIQTLKKEKDLYHIIKCGIIILKKHVDCDHAPIVNFFLMRK
jgi:hypothetical protein